MLTSVLTVSPQTPAPTRVTEHPTIAPTPHPTEAAPTPNPTVRVVPTVVEIIFPDSPDVSNGRRQGWTRVYSVR